MPVINVRNSEEDTIVFENVYTDNKSALSLISNESQSLLYGEKSSAANTDEYAIFGGNSNNGKNVLVYDNHLTKTLLEDKLGSVQLPAATNNGNDYIAFGGGYTTENNYWYATEIVVVFKLPSLTAQNAPSTLSYNANNLAATSIGNYALFGGGYYARKDSATNKGPISYVECYDKSLTKSIRYMANARSGLAATSIGDYALFGGGIGGDADNPGTSALFSTVDAVNTSLTRTAATNLGAARYFLSAASNKNYALFGGGRLGSRFSNTVDAYNSSLTRTSATALSKTTSQIATTSICNHYVLFLAGTSSNYSVFNAYDPSLTRSNITAISGYYGGSAASIGNRSIWITSWKEVIYNGLEYELNMEIPAYSKYKFADETEQATTMSPKTKLYTSSTPISGYIKKGANRYVTGLVE